MITYVAAAAVLTIAVLMLSLAARHQTLLNPAVERSLVERLEKLTPSARGRWGRMSVSQMLRHLAGAIRMSTGDLQIAPRKTPLRMFPLKQLIIFVLPFPKGAPTAPALMSRDEADFGTEHAAVRDLLTSFTRRQIAPWPDHPAFGPLNRDQWGVMVWKHVDHHLRQFGV